MVKNPRKFVKLCMTVNAGAFLISTVDKSHIFAVCLLGRLLIGIGTADEMGDLTGETSC